MKHAGKFMANPLIGCPIDSNRRVPSNSWQVVGYFIINLYIFIFTLIFKLLEDLSYELSGIGFGKWFLNKVIVQSLYGEKKFLPCMPFTVASILNDFHFVY